MKKLLSEQFSFSSNMYLKSLKCKIMNSSCVSSATIFSMVRRDPSNGMIWMFNRWEEQNHIIRSFSSSLHSSSESFKKDNPNNNNTNNNKNNLPHNELYSSKINQYSLVDEYIHRDDDDAFKQDQYMEAYYQDLLRDLPPHLYFNETSTNIDKFSHEMIHTYDREFQEMFKLSDHHHEKKKHTPKSSQKSFSSNHSRSNTSNNRTTTKKLSLSSTSTTEKPQTKSPHEFYDSLASHLNFYSSSSFEQPEILSEKHEQSLYLKEEFMQHAQQAQDELLRYFYLGMDRATRARLSISDLKGHLYAFATDKFGSAFISNCLQVRKIWISKDSSQFKDLQEYSEIATEVIQRGEDGFWMADGDTRPRRVLQGFTDAELELLFEELKPHFDTLVTHTYAKFIMYHFLKVCTPQQRLYVAQNAILRRVESLLSTKGGSMICEQIFELLSSDGEVEVTQKMLSEIENRISALIWDPIAQYFLRAIAEFGTTNQKLTILEKLKDQPLMDLLKTHQPSKIMQLFTKFSETRDILLRRLSKKDYVNLACHVYGAFFIVGCMKFGSYSQRRRLIDSFKGNILLMALNISSSYVLNHAFRAAIPSEVSNIVNELQGHFLVISQDRYANFLMKQILCLTNNVQYLNMVVQEMRKNFALLSYQRYGSLVVEYVLNLIVYYSKKRVQVGFSVNDFLKEEFSAHALQMAKDKYAAHTCQLVLQIAYHKATAHLLTKETKAELLKDLWDHSMTLALDPFGCHVIQYLVRNEETRMPMMRKFLETDGNIKEFNSRSFFTLIQNKQGVSVVIELIKQCNTNQRNALFNVMNSYRLRIEDSPYSRQLMEFVKNYDEMGLFANQDHLQKSQQHQKQQQKQQQ